MPTKTIPLILPTTARGWAASIGTSAKDQQLINGLYLVSQNNLAKTKNVSIQKRGGSTTGSTIGTNAQVLTQYSGLNSSGVGFGALYSTSSELFDGTTSMGSLAGNGPVASQILADTVINGVPVVAFVTTNEGWFLYLDAETTNFPTFTGNRTSGSAVISGIASTTGIYKGQAISGTGIPASTRVLSVDSGTQITMDANATSGAGTATTITKEAIALITDAQFPSAPNSIVAMDGYFFAGADDGVIYQSAINDPSSWASSDTLTPDAFGDSISFIFRVGNYIASAGMKYSIQYFYNAGNASGSVLSPSENLNVVGLKLVTTPIPFSDGMYCVAQPGSSTASGAEALYRLTGVNSFQKVSDSYWTDIISDGGVFALGSIQTPNKTLVAVLTAEAAFPVYDPSTGEFSIFVLSDWLRSSFATIFTKSAETTSFSWSGGDTWTDSSSAYTMTAQTQPVFINGGSPFIIAHVDLIAGDTESTGTATLYVTRDDYATWESVGTFDMTAQRKRIHALGWFQSNVAFKVEHSANTNFRAQALAVSWN